MGESHCRPACEHYCVTLLFRVRICLPLCGLQFSMLSASELRTELVSVARFDAADTRIDLRLSHASLERAPFELFPLNIVRLNLSHNSLQRLPATINLPSLRSVFLPSETHVRERV